MMLPKNLFSSMTVVGLPPLPLYSEKEKGCGYTGQTDAMHTIQITPTNNFIGKIVIEGTLETDPKDIDWYVITDLGNGLTALPDQVETINFSGNHVWIRCVITSFTAGDLNRVTFAHN